SLPHRSSGARSARSLARHRPAEHEAASRSPSAGNPLLGRWNCRQWQPYDEGRAPTILAIAGLDRAAHGLDEAAANGKPEAGPCPSAVPGVHAVELVENVLQILRRNAATLVEQPQAYTVARARGQEADGGARGRIFHGIVQE